MTPTRSKSAILDIAADAADMPSSELVARISDLVREARRAEREQCLQMLADDINFGSREGQYLILVAARIFGVEEGAI